ncbi:acyl carrier protein [Desulfovibrio sp. ZJ200]|uniref:acyl carrier protein n=1 Tax=Desulfovibrio sp. ZJ200 TaxID=2709792 RepID=UPI0013EAC815|nr:acyl carrier protein [Desulfovibrio sp. ZJ200]
MTKKEFLCSLQEILQCSESIEETTVLTDLEEWDSLAFMVLIAFFDKSWGQRIIFDDLKSIRTAADLIAMTRGAVA